MKVLLPIPPGPDTPRYRVTFTCGSEQEIAHLPSLAVEYCRSCQKWESMSDRGVKK